MLERLWHIGMLYVVGHVSEIVQKYFPEVDIEQSGVVTILSLKVFI